MLGSSLHMYTPRKQHSDFSQDSNEYYEEAVWLSD